MKTLLLLEELAQFLIATILFYQLGFSWWVFPALILLPDLSMVGYLISPAWGAISYNFIHHKALGIALFLWGIYINDTTLKASGLILYAHSSMDRIFGYGLKYSDNFKNTHLGIIGK
ncbi:MAG: DUF4260 domain-containing protein [Bacteroidota bacterium]